MEKKKKGFALMSKERQLEIARKGGLSVPDEKRSFSTDRDLAARAGKLGGASIPAEKRSFSTDNELAVRAGKLGNKKSQENREE